MNVDREKRKIIRRNRGAARLQGDSGNHQESHVENVNSSNLTSQLLLSSKTLSDFNSSLLSHFAEIKTQLEKNEIHREKTHELAIVSNQTRLENQIKSVEHTNLEIEQQWSKIREKDIPQEIQDLIGIQMSKCNSISSSKDDLIKDLQTLLELQDKNYFNSLRNQDEQLQNLIAKWSTELNSAQVLNENQTTLIRESILLDRSAQIQNHLRTQNGTLTNHHENWQNNLALMESNEKDYQMELDKMNQNGLNSYCDLKFELESNIQTLSQQLEEMKATYFLNSEKLNYNYRVLVEVDNEKINEREKHKRKLIKIKDQLNTLISQYASLEMSKRKATSDLINDYRGLTKKYKDLQAKFKVKFPRK
jgi:dynein regulatory complex protein 1